MPVTISRRSFLKSAAIVSGALGVEALAPRGLLSVVPVASKGSCGVGGNGAFIGMEESKLGQTLSFHRVYKAWDEELFSDDVVASADKGRRLVMSVFPANQDGTGARRWGDIASGKYDADMADFAAQLIDFSRTHHRKVGLSFNHEPENDRDESLGDIHLGDEADFRAAAMHFFSYLTSHGVTNIRRTLILAGSTYSSGRADDYWPGSTYIDRLGADCYNWFGTDHPGARWRSFQQVVQGFYDYAVGKGKLAWVCETASMEDPGDPNRKAQWITDMGTTLKSMPEIKAVMWYDGGTNGWSLSDPPQGSAAALSSFRALLGETYFA